jgi:hypothetical protein
MTLLPMSASSPPHPGLGAVGTFAADAAFTIVFGLFVAALVVLAVVTVVWAVRHDRPGLEAWRQRMLERGRTTGSERTNGRRPGGGPEPPDVK